MIQGQHPVITPIKEDDFRASMRVCLRLGCGRKALNYPFRIIDMCCGCGWNEVGCDGSPIEALKLMREYRRQFTAFFCDKDERAIAGLKKRIQKMGYRTGPNSELNGMIACWHRSNVGLLRIVGNYLRMMEEDPRYAVGFNLCDPNGCSPGGGFPLLEIAEFHNEWQRIDPIINFPLRALHRNLGLGQKTVWKSLPHETPEATASRRKKHLETVWEKWPARSLSEALALFHGKHWLLHEPNCTSGHDYVIVVGRSATSGRTPGDPALGLWPEDSARGQEILAWADQDVPPGKRRKPWRKL